jgi:hypothetical protein
MADQAPGVTIVDEHGIKHQFPAGFDPLRAAQIVRQNSKQDPGMLSQFVDWATTPTRAGTAIQTGAGETANAIDTANRVPVHMSLWDVAKQSPGIIKDIASGLVNNPIATLRGGAAGIEQGIGDQAAAMSSPMALTAMGAGPIASRVAPYAPGLANLVRMGGAGANGLMTEQGVQQALTAPDAEGKIMGGVQALLGAHGTATNPEVVGASRKVAAPVGRAMIEASKKPGFIHGSVTGMLGGLMTGSVPEGAMMGATGMVMIPPALRSAGEGLVKFGEGTTGVQPTGASTGGEPLARPEGRVRAGNQTIGETAGEAAKRMADEAKAARRAGVQSIPADQAVGAAQYLADLQNLSPAERRAAMAARTAAAPARRAAAAVEAPTPGAPSWLDQIQHPAAEDLQTTGKMEDILAQRQPAGLLTGGTGPTGLDLLKNQTKLIDQLPAEGPNSGPAPAGFRGDKFGSDLAAGRNLFGGNIPETSSIESRLPRATDENPMIKSIGPDAAAADSALHLDRATRNGGPHGMQAQMLEALAGRGGELPAGAEVTGEAPYDPNNPLPGPAVGELPKGTPPPVGLPADAEITGEESPIGQQASGPNAGGSTGIELQSFEEALASAMREGTGKPAEAEAAPPISMTEPNVVPDNDPRLAGPVPASAIQAPLAAEPVEAPPATVPKPRVRVTAEGDVQPKGPYVHPDTGEMMHPIRDVFEPSKSRRGKSQMSATKGYTNADMTAMGLEPKTAVTHITKAQAEAGKAARAARTSKYYQDALESKAQAEAGM